MRSINHFQERLIAYHFGTLPDDQIIAVEEKLLSSPACLTEFFALKRAFEEVPEQQLAPSSRLKARLRADIAATLHQESMFDKLLSFLTIKKSWALAASAAALVVAGVLATHLPEKNADKVPSSPSSDPTQRWSIDTAENVAISLNYL